MIGSFLTRIITMALGYIYPAYECFKTVEQRRPNVEILRFWCQYWIIIAIVTVVERFGDALISWLPMYSEAKLAFIVYLWYPKTKGTSYVYHTFLRPYITSRESEIDQHLSNLQARAIDLVVMNWQRGASFTQAKFIEVLQFLASQNRPPQQAPPNYNAVPPPPPPALGPQGLQAPPPVLPQAPPPVAPQGPGPHLPAGYFPPPPGYEASAPLPPAPVIPPSFPPPQNLPNLPDDSNYRQGFYPPLMAYQPPPQPPVQHRGATLRQEIDLEDEDEEGDYIMAPAQPANGAAASSSSSSRYMTRSRQRASVTSSVPNRGW